MGKNKSGIKSKIFRKIHYYFDMNLKDKTSPWINNFLYPAYRHRKHIPKTEDLNSLYITQIPNDGAGIGHQMSNILGGIHIARTLGMKYAYPGLKGKESWESFLGVNQNSISVQELKKQGYKIKMLPCFNTDVLSDNDVLTDNNDGKKYSQSKNETLEIIKKIIKSYAGQKIIFSVYLDQSYRNQYEEIEYIKSRFESAEAREADKLIFDKDQINIAVHIRRGDIVSGQTTGQKTLTKRWLDMDYYENVVSRLTEQIKSKYPEKNYRIYLFSEGKADEYRSFEKYGEVTFCFDMSAMDSFLHMTRADYLVLSKSSFSYVPALLSDGVRICPTGFWHGYPNDKKWIVVNETIDKTFDLNI